MLILECQTYHKSKCGLEASLVSIFVNFKHEVDFKLKIPWIWFLSSNKSMRIGET